MGKAMTRPGPGAAGLKQTIEGFGNLRLRVGFFPEATYEGGTPVAYVAAIQEFGSGPIPPRPFMRPTAAEKQTEWNETLASAARAVARGAVTAEAALGALGGVAAGDVQQTISDIQTPPLSMTTLLARKWKADNPNGTLGGATIGQLNRNANFIGPREKADKSADVSGVSRKPLVDDGILLASVSFFVDRNSGDAT